MQDSDAVIQARADRLAEFQRQVRQCGVREHGWHVAGGTSEDPVVAPDLSCHGRHYNMALEFDGYAHHIMLSCDDGHWRFLHDGAIYMLNPPQAKTSPPAWLQSHGVCVERRAYLPTLDTRFDQQEFDLAIGGLDRVLSLLVNYAKGRSGDLDDANRQTLKHHAEDMQAAAECIMKHIGAVEGTPQPGGTPDPSTCPECPPGGCDGAQPCQDPPATAPQ